MLDHKRLRIFIYSRHRNVFLRWFHFCVVNFRGGARRFFYHFCPTFVCCRDIEVFSTIFTSSCNVVATTAYIFEREESTYTSRVQKCFFYEDAGIIREYDHGSTEPTIWPLRPTIVVIFSVFSAVSENILSLKVLYLWLRYQPCKILLQTS